MDYYCDVCEKTIQLKSNKNHPKSLPHIQYERSFRISHTITNPNYFDMVKIINNYMANHKKKFDLYLLKCDFKLVFINFTPHNKTYFHRNTSNINLKRNLLYWIEYFIERGHKFCLINEMKITTINEKMNVTYQHHVKQPMQAVEIRLKVNIVKNPHLINSLNRYINHPLIRKYYHIPFNN